MVVQFLKLCTSAGDELCFLYFSRRRRFDDNDDDGGDPKDALRSEHLVR